MCACAVLLAAVLPRATGCSNQWFGWDALQQAEQDLAQQEPAQTDAGPEAPTSDSGTDVGVDDGGGVSSTDNADSTEPAETEAERAQREREQMLAEYTGLLQGGYYFDQLGQEDREKYIAFYRAFETREGQEYPNKDEADINRISQYVLSDHPEMFHVDGVTWEYYPSGQTSVVNGDYCYPEGDQAQLSEQLQAAVNECVQGIPADADDYAKARYVYEYLVANTTYNTGIVGMTDTLPGDQAGQNAVNCLVEHSCVCAGYASAFQLIMHELGIPCTDISGVITEDNENHAWNAVRLDGDWYFVDVTWGDPDSEDNGAFYPPGTPRYGYLCVTTDPLMQGRVVDDWVILPECAATQDNYFVREGRMLDYLDEGQIIAWCQESVDNGSRFTEFGLSNQEAFDQTVWYVEEELANAGGFSFSYVTDDDTRTVAISVQ